MPDVFLSYKREDLKAATRLVKGLRGEGIEVWWDRDIPAGAPWEATIEKALAEARAVLVCWSKAAVASDNVRSEARWAREQGRLIQIFVEPCNPPLFFGEHQGVDLSDWTGDPSDERFRDLASALHDRLGQDAGPKSEKDRSPKGSLRIARWRVRAPRNVLIIAATVIGVALAAVGGWIVTEGFSQPPADRIAILPFTTPGAGDDVKAFAAGVTDELTGVLSGNGRPIVSGPEAQILLGPDAAGQARKLGVGLVFGGSVQREADQLKVRVRVDDPRHGVTVWTAEMEGAADQAEALEGQLGARVIAVLNCSAKGLQPGRGLSDPDAMTLLLKACDIFEDQIGPGDSQAIFDLLDTARQLVAKAPRFAAGHSLLAKFDAYLRSFLASSMNDQLVREATKEIDEALRLDPTDGDAHVALYLLRPTADFMGREKAIMGVPFDPSWPYAEIFKGSFLWDVGRVNEALAAEQRADATNPLSTDADPVQWLAAAGRTEDADREFTRLSRLWPASFLWVDRLMVYEADGNWQGLQTFVDTPSQRPSTMTENQLARLKLVVAAGRTHAPADMARARAALLAVRPGETIGLGDQVTDLALLGFVDDAFALANRVRRQDLTLNNPPSALFTVPMAAMRRDPRFIALADHFGLLDYWKKSGVWPDFCSEPTLPYDCKSEAAKLANRRPSSS